MCCLFGLIDYGNHFTGRQKSKLLSVLAAECEARGTDATGIAYNHAGRLSIYKRPLPAHHLKFRIPNDSKVVMGHTRLTTQGSEKLNQNNHPFRGKVDLPFALAHNGVLYNDRYLRSSLSLPGNLNTAFGGCSGIGTWALSCTESPLLMAVLRIM